MTLRYVNKSNFVVENCGKNYSRFGIEDISLKVSNQLLEIATHYERLVDDFQRQQHFFWVFLKFDITLESLVRSNRDYFGTFTIA